MEPNNNDNDDFFKNQEQIHNDEYESVSEEEEWDGADEEEYMEESSFRSRRDPEGAPSASTNPAMNNYEEFMKQASEDYMMYSTMDIMKTMNIFGELRQLFANLSDWDRIVIFYAYELMQRNMQLCYKIGLYLFKTRNEELVAQMIYWGLLLFCMANVQTAYSYLIYRVYLIDHDFARRLHEHLKSQFFFFENPEEMNGAFNDYNLPNRLDARRN